MAEHESQLLGATPQSLAGLVAYQTGSVVSRTLVKKTAGTVTVFAFDRDQALSEHTAPFDALLCVLDGEGEFTVGGTKHTVRSGETFLLPAGVPHAVRAVAPMKMLLVMIRS